MAHPQRKRACRDLRMAQTPPRAKIERGLGFQRRACQALDHRRQHRGIGKMPVASGKFDAVAGRTRDARQRAGRGRAQRETQALVAPLVALERREQRRVPGVRRVERVAPVDGQKHHQRLAARGCNQALQPRGSGQIDQGARRVGVRPRQAAQQTLAPFARLRGCLRQQRRVAVHQQPACTRHLRRKPAHQRSGAGAKVANQRIPGQACGKAACEQAAACACIGARTQGEPGGGKAAHARHRKNRSACVGQSGNRRPAALRA